MSFKLPQRRLYEKQQKQQDIWWSVKQQVVEKKNAEKITKVISKSTFQDPKQFAQKQNPTETCKETYVPPEKQQQIIDRLQLL